MPAVEPVTRAVLPERSMFMRCLRMLLCWRYWQRPTRPQSAADHVRAIASSRRPGGTPSKGPVLSRGETPKQTMGVFVGLGWFAEPVIGPRFARTRWLAMTGKNKKAALAAPLFKLATKRVGLRRFRFLRLDRPGILALGIDVAVDELDHRHRGVVAVAEARLDDAGVAALSVLVAGGEHIEQLLDLVGVAHFADRLAARGKPALLAERNQLLDDRPQLLRLGQRGDDLLVLDQRRTHVGEHRAPVLVGAVELPMTPAVTHV